jgi:hypothetical protein
VFENFKKWLRIITAKGAVLSTRTAKTDRYAVRRPLSSFLLSNFTSLDILRLTNFFPTDRRPPTASHRLPTKVRFF